MELLMKNLVWKPHYIPEGDRFIWSFPKIKANSNLANVNKMISNLVSPGSLLILNCKQ